MQTPEESLSQELYSDESSDESSDTENHPLNPRVDELKKLFLKKDMQSLLASDIKLEPDLWIALCEQVLWHVTNDTVVLLPAFLTSETIEFIFNIVIDDWDTCCAFNMSPIEAILCKISLGDFRLDSHKTSTKLFHDVLPFLMQQPISQEIIDVLFSKLCTSQSYYLDFPHISLEYLLKFDKVSPEILHMPLHKEGLIAFYKKVLNSNNFLQTKKYLPLPVAYKQEALNEYKQTILDDHITTFLRYWLFSMNEHVQDCVGFAGYTDCMFLVLKTMHQVYEASLGPFFVNTFFNHHQRLEKTHKEEKEVYNNTLLKFWLFSEADVLSKDVKPAIAKNMHDLYVVERKELSNLS